MFPQAAFDTIGLEAQDVRKITLSNHRGVPSSAHPPSPSKWHVLPSVTAGQSTGLG